MILIDWTPNSDFMIWFQRIVAEASRRWRGEPGEALGGSWIHLRGLLPEGRPIDPEDKLLRRIIHRKVSNFFRSRRLVRREEIAKPDRDPSPDPSILAESSELREAFASAMTDLSPRSREAVAVLTGVGDGRSVKQVATSWNMTPQYVHKLGSRGINELRTSMTRFDPRPNPGRHR